MQSRIGPNRVGPRGWLQWLADGLKLILKEDVVPTQADAPLFRFAPYLMWMAVFATFVVLPLSASAIVADLNVGLLFLVSITALTVIAVLLGGWSSNSKWSLLGGMRSAAQIVSYELPAALALLQVALLAGTLSPQAIVRAQGGLPHQWFAFANPFAFASLFIYFIAGLAEGNRTPFDLPEAESELVAGFHTEYSGFRWALYFLAEYANIFVVSSVAVTLFFGGWLRPFPSVGWLDIPLNMVFPVVLIGGSGVLTFPLVKKLKDPIQQKVLVGAALVLLLIAALFAIPAVNAAVIGMFWFLLKVSCIIYLMIWFRGTFPRFRYDQLMNIGWKVAIPVGMAAVFVNALIGMWRHSA
jgi:NADH-quinone oxidoreductase subunit H